MRRPLGQFWPTWRALMGDWLIILASVAAAETSHSWWLTAAAIVVIASRQHALLVLVHESAHFNLAPNKRLNDWLSDLFCAWPVLFDTTAYRANHLAHHRHLNTKQDPDWVRKVGRPDWTFPVSANSVLRFLPYFVFFRGPFEWSFIAYKFSGLNSRERWRATPSLLLIKIVYFVAAALAITYFGFLREFTLYWVLPLFLAFPSIQRLRSIAEHFALPATCELDSSRNITPRAWEAFLFSPHNVNFHLLHHMYPHVPFHELPARFEKESAGALKHGYRNTSFLFPFSGSVLKDILTGHPQTHAEGELRHG